MSVTSGFNFIKTILPLALFKVILFFPGSAALIFATTQISRSNSLFHSIFIFSPLLIQLPEIIRGLTLISSPSPARLSIISDCLPELLFTGIIFLTFSAIP